MTKFKKSLAALMAVVSTASALCVPMGASAEETVNNNIESVFINDEFSAMANGDTRSAAAIYNYTLPNYPTERQASNNTCWASSIRSMYIYGFGSGYTKTDTQLKAIAAQGGYSTTDGLNLEGATYVLSKLFTPQSGFNFNVHSTGVLTMQEIKNNVGAGLPVYMHCCDSSFTKGHACVLVGYDLNVSTGVITKLYYFNPALGEIVGSDPYTADSPITVFQGSKMFYWTDSVVLY